LALTEGAILVVEIRDTSHADAATPLIVRQTISCSRQTPIKFKVKYNRDDIDPRNTYSISADIIEADGRFAFTNETAHNVITGGNPSNVDILLVLIKPSPDLIPDGSTDSNWRDRVEAPARVIHCPLAAETAPSVLWGEDEIVVCVLNGEVQEDPQGLCFVGQSVLLGHLPEPVQLRLLYLKSLGNLVHRHS